MPPPLSTNQLLFLICPLRTFVFAVATSNSVISALTIVTPKYLSDASFCTPAAAKLCLVLETAFKSPWLASRPLEIRRIRTLADFIAPPVGPGTEEGPHSGLNLEDAIEIDRTAG